MAVPLLDLSRQYAYLKPEIEKAVFDVLDNSSFILGPQVEKFEEQVAALCEIKHAMLPWVYPRHKSGPCWERSRRTRRSKPPPCPLFHQIG